MKTRIAISALFLAAAAASAQDGGTPPKPADPVKPAPPAAPAVKRERKTSPEAEAAIKKYASLLHFPNSAYKTLEMNSHCDVPQFGGEVGCKFLVKESGEIGFEVLMPEAMRQQYGDQLAEIKSTAKSMVEGIFKPFLVAPDVMAKQYDLAAKKDKDKTVVEIARFAEKAEWDKAAMTFNADGLVEKVVGTPNIDPNDRMAAMNAGAEIEVTFEYKKRGDLYTIEGAKLVQPTGETGIKLSYFEVAGTAPLPKQIDVESPILGSLTISIHDFVLNGKKVVGTERKDEPKPAKPPVAPKAGDPPKPAK